MHITHLLGKPLPGRWRIALATLGVTACSTLALATVGSLPANAAGHAAVGFAPDIAAVRGASAPVLPGKANDRPFGLKTEMSHSKSVGYSTVYVWNCHGQNRPIAVSSFDYNTNSWQYHGVIRSQWDRPFIPRVCGPRISSPGMTISLQDGHQYYLVASDSGGVLATLNPLPGGNTAVFNWTVGS